VAGSLRHSLSRGFDSSGSSCYQVLLPFRITAGATYEYWAGPQHGIPSNTGGFAALGSEQDAHHIPGICRLGHPPPDKERPSVDHAANLVDHLHDIHSYARQHQKLASDRMKTRYDRLTNCAGLPRGRQHVDLSAHPRERKVTQASIPMGGPIQGSHADKWCGNPKSRMVVVHMDRFAPYQGTARDERP
jgi:hypothetical protein